MGCLFGYVDEISWDVCFSVYLSKFVEIFAWVCIWAYLLGCLLEYVYEQICCDVFLSAHMPPILWLVSIKIGHCEKFKMMCQNIHIQMGIIKYYTSAVDIGENFKMCTFLLLLSPCMFNIYALNVTRNIKNEELWLNDRIGGKLVPDKQIKCSTLKQW